MKTYRHTYKINKNPRHTLNTGYLRSINAIDSTGVMIVRWY